jgi:hypothetical protein
MFRRAAVVTSCVTFGLAAGLVLTGRMRTADETSAAPGPQSAGSVPHAQTAPAIAGGMPDLTVVA